jgi:hypothetical protein
MGHDEVGPKKPPQPRRATNRCRAQLGWVGGGVGGGGGAEFLSFLPIFCSLFDRVLKGIFFFFFLVSNAKKKYLVRSLSCYGFKTQGMNFMYQAIFCFL